MSPVGSIFVPSPPKTGTNSLHPLSPPIVGRVVRFSDGKRQRAEETANASAMQAAQKDEEERQKRQEIQAWNPRMSSLQAVQIALEVKSGTTAAEGRLNTADEKKQEQGEAAGYFQRTGPSGGPGFRRELTHRGLLDRLGQRSSTHRAEDPYDDGESDVLVGFGSLGDRNHPDDDPMSPPILEH